MQILEPPQTTSYSNSDGHFIKTFLISTKFNEAGWGVSKDTFREKIQSFIGKPFVIIPEHLSSQRQKGHIFADSKEALLEEYKKYTHGIISSVSEPFQYNDGTDDLFAMADITLSDSKAASTLLEHGNKTFGVFSVSPHVWGTFDGNEIAQDWEGISVSLVPKGAYGQDAVVSKYCKGDAISCTKSLAASLCDKEDSKAASMISSLLSENENKSIMDSTTVQVPQVLPVPNTQPVQEQKEDKNEELENLKKQLEQAQNAAKEKEETVTKLLNKDKTNTLSTIFKGVKEDTVKESLIQKYLDQDTDKLNEFYKDVTAHVLPSLIEEAKAQAEAELKNKTVEENKSKSKAGSLPKEPVVEESKAASIVPKSENQVLKFDRILRGFQ